MIGFQSKRKNGADLIKCHFHVRDHFRPEQFSRHNSNPHEGGRRINNGAPIQRWITHWAHTVEGDVCIDCLPYWLHPEYQSAAAVGQWRPSGRYWQLSAGVCFQPGRRQGGREAGRKRGREEGRQAGRCTTRITVCLTLRSSIVRESRRSLMDGNMLWIERTNKSRHTPGWASWCPCCIPPSASPACLRSRSLQPGRTPCFHTEIWVIISKLGWILRVNSRQVLTLSSLSSSFICRSFTIYSMMSVWLFIAAQCIIFRPSCSAKTNTPLNFQTCILCC